MCECCEKQGWKGKLKFECGRLFALNEFSSFFYRRVNIFKDGVSR